MQLRECEFVGLPGAEKLVLDDLHNLTTLIGVNGGGKSTILRALKLAFDILAKRSVAGQMPAHQAWDRFISVSLRFTSGDPVTSPRLERWLEAVTDISIVLTCNSSTYSTALVVGGRILDFQKTIPVEDRMAADNALVAARLEIQNAEGQLQSNTGHAPFQIRVNAARAALPGAETRAKEAGQTVAIDAGTDRPMPRDDADGLLLDLKLPSYLYVPARSAPELSIEDLIRRLLVLKKGDRNKSADYARSHQRLEELLQAEVDPHETPDGKTQTLLVDGVPWQHASTGTDLTLRFFAIESATDPGSIVLWDEPENGLHPSRRHRLVDLMLGDTRQFVIATHATEMAPVTRDVRARTFRCESTYDREQRSVHIAIHAVVTRRHAFATAEALGLQPARVLFTASVIVWIEGPSELAFYRHWLRPTLASAGVHEGLHYSYMHYGGGLLGYASVADDDEFKSLFDLLSLSRNALILLDSDNRIPESDDDAITMKTHVERLQLEVAQLHHTRPGAVVIRPTRGREVENYLPGRAVAHAVATLWTQHDEHALEALDLAAIEYPKDRRYYETLRDRFISKGYHRKPPHQAQARGETRWGERNKVNFMRAALSTPSLKPAELLCDGEAELNAIAKFIGAHADDGKK